MEKNCGLGNCWCLWLTYLFLKIINLWKRNRIWWANITLVGQYIVMKRKLMTVLPPSIQNPCLHSLPSSLFEGCYETIYGIMHNAVHQPLCGYYAFTQFNAKVTYLVFKSFITMWYHNRKQYKKCVMSQPIIFRTWRKWYIKTSIFLFCSAPTFMWLWNLLKIWKITSIKGKLIKDV